MWSRSEHDVGEAGWRKVTEWACTGEKEIYNVSVATPSGRSETYRCTDTHPFWMEKGGDDGQGGFLAARSLRAGDQLRLGDGSPAYVTGVEATGVIEPVYNFSVDGWHTYHVGELGVWVHNTCYLDKVSGQWVNANGTFNYMDPLRGTMVHNVPRDGLTGDHLLPRFVIERADGWSSLSRSQQSAILNDPTNLMPLPRGMNASKGKRIEYDNSGGWTHFRGEAVHPEFKTFLETRQIDYRIHLETEYGLRFPTR